MSITSAVPHVSEIVGEQTPEVDDPPTLAHRLVMFLADENIEHGIIARLRADGHDVASIAELSPGIDDERVLARANDEGRILITSDHDFGELVYRLGRVAAGVLLVRVHGLSAERKAAMVSAAIGAHGSELTGAFTVIAPGSVRIRRR